MDFLVCSQNIGLTIRDSQFISTFLPRDLVIGNSLFQTPSTLPSPNLCPLATPLSLGQKLESIAMNIVFRFTDVRKLVRINLSKQATPSRMVCCNGRSPWCMRRAFTSGVIMTDLMATLASLVIRETFLYSPINVDFSAYVFKI